MKEDTISLPLGFRFVVGNDIVEVQEENHLCERCFFFNAKASYPASACTSLKSYPWSMIVCSASLRSDGKNVSFVKVGEMKP